MIPACGAELCADCSLSDSVLLRQKRRAMSAKVFAGAPESIAGLSASAVFWLD
jgi:hypothetical protein